MPSCSLMCSGIKNLPEKGLAEGLGSISTALCPGRSRVSTLHPMGLILAAFAGVPGRSRAPSKEAQGPLPPWLFSLG